MKEFQYFTPTKVYFGEGSHLKLKEALNGHHFKRALLHYGSDRVKEEGLLAEVSKQLEEVGISCFYLGGVVPNPHLSKVREGIALAQEKDIDLIVAVGAGSALDSAKGIAVGALSEYDIWSHYERINPVEKALPIISIMTFASTGSEMSKSSVITNEDTQVKRSISSDYVRPLYAFLNPELTLTVPEYQSMAGCSDIFMHTMERYFDKEGNLGITESLAESLMRDIIATTRKLKKDLRNYDLRAEVMWMSALSHNGLLGNAGDWACHRLEHELSGIYDVTHGAGLCALWGSWAKYVYQEDRQRFLKFANRVCGIEGNDDETIFKAIEYMEDFFKEIGMPINLQELGLALNDADITNLAKHCISTNKDGIGSIKKLYEEDMFAIYMKARG